MFGGDGADVFVIGATDDKDRIDQFDLLTDRLDLRGAGLADLASFQAIARDIGPHLRLDFAPDHLVTLTNVSVADLDADNFFF